MEKFHFHPAIALRVMQHRFRRHDHRVIPFTALSVIINQDIADCIIRLPANFDAVAVDAAIENARLQVECRPLFGNVDE